jgi:hypothetical protein
MTKLIEEEPMTATGLALEPVPTDTHLLRPLLEWAEREPDRPLAGTGRARKSTGSPPANSSAASGSWPRVSSRRVSAPATASR